MKRRSNSIMTILLMIALIFTCLPSSVYAKMLERGEELFHVHSKMDEMDIYNQKKQSSADELIAEIMDLEEALPSKDDMFAILPHLVALMEKKDEFTSNQLIDLIKDEKTYMGLDSACVKMYVEKGENISALLPLLQDEGIDTDVKVLIVALGKFSTDELSSVFEDHKDNVSVTAMKRLTIEDKYVAYSLASELLANSGQKLTSEQYISICLGLAEYFESHVPKSDSERKTFLEEREWAVTQLWGIHDTHPDDIVQAHAIYTLGRMHDYDIFKRIIDSETVDFCSKITVIEENVPLMLEIVSQKSDMERLDTIVHVMKIHPIKEVGEALSKAIAEGSIPETKEMMELIDYIEIEGISAVWLIQEEDSFENHY